MTGVQTCALPICEVWLQPDGAVPYQDIIRVMDTVYEVFGLASRNEVTIRFL